MRTRIMDTQAAESGQCLMFQLFASVPVRNKNPHLASAGAEGAFHLQSVSECVLVCVNVAALSGHCAAASS